MLYYLQLNLQFLNYDIQFMKCVRPICLSIEIIPNAIRSHQMRSYFQNCLRGKPTNPLLGRSRYATSHGRRYPVSFYWWLSFWKPTLTPILDKPLSAVLSLQIIHQSIDEMIVPYKGCYIQIRHYIKGKPNCQGFQNFGNVLHQQLTT